MISVAYVTLFIILNQSVTSVGYNLGDECGKKVFG